MYHMKKHIFHIYLCCIWLTDLWSMKIGKFSAYLSQKWCEQLSLSNVGTVLRNSNIIWHHVCSREIKTKTKMLDAVFFFFSTAWAFYLVCEQDSLSLEGLHMLGHLMTATVFRDMIKWTLVLYTLASCLWMSRLNP